MVFFTTFQFVRHFFLSTDLHGLHAPFQIDFYKNVLKSKNKVELADITNLVSKIQQNHELINLVDLGAGSKMDKSFKKKVSSIYKHASSPKAFSEFLHRLIKHYQTENILELGSSLGINTAYMAKALPTAKVVSIEGCPQTAAKAKQHLAELAISNVDIIIGNIDDELDNAISQLGKIDLAYIDANHTFEACLTYFQKIKEHSHENTIIVVDDIYWSAGMQAAWKEILNDRDFPLKIDLFEAGILFKNSSLTTDQLRLLHFFW